MKKIAVLLIIILAMVATSACGTKKPKTSPVTTPKNVVQTVDAFGVIKAKDSKNISVDFSAKVKNIYIKEGQKVKSGDSLIQLDLTDYKSQLSAKASELRIAKYDLASTENSSLGNFAEIQNIQSDIATKRKNLKYNTDPDISKVLNSISLAKAQYTKALKDLTTKEELFKEGVISQSEFADFKVTVDAKKADLADAKNMLESQTYNKQKEIDQLQTSLIQKTAQVDDVSSAGATNAVKSKYEKIDQLQSDLNLSQSKLSKSYLKGDTLICDVPKGIVFDIGYLQGDMASEAKKVFSIMNLDSMVVEANVPEEFIKDIKLGAQVTFSPQADKSKTYKGKVSYIASSAIVVNGETDIPIEVSIDNKDDFLMPNFNVDLKIVVGK